jgi:hypothetical protein
MKKLLNTLYVTSEGAYLRKDGETIAVDIDGATRARGPRPSVGPDCLFRTGGGFARIDGLCRPSWHYDIVPGLFGQAAGTG